jgi:hypothetical protein
MKMKLLYIKFRDPSLKREKLRIWKCDWGNTKLLRIGFFTHGYLELYYKGVK